MNSSIKVHYNHNLYSRFVKPLADFVLAFVILLISFPLIVFLLILIYVHFKANPIFKQLRPGLNGKLFFVFKLRTMNNRTNKDGVLLPDKDRLTQIGKTIRSLSLDELLQLINILKGDMSFVGPRPLLPEYLPLYNKEQNRRHYVKPGITGWAQVNGRNAISWHQKFELDIWYVDNQSLLLDLKILAMTIIKVFKRDGITSETSVTIEKFNGNN